MPFEPPRPGSDMTQPRNPAKATIYIGGEVPESAFEEFVETVLASPAGAHEALRDAPPEEARREIERDVRGAALRGGAAAFCADPDEAWSGAADFGRLESWLERHELPYVRTGVGPSGSCWVRSFRPDIAEGEAAVFESQVDPGTMAPVVSWQALARHASSTFGAIEAGVEKFTRHFIDSDGPPAIQAPEPAASPRP